MSGWQRSIVVVWHLLFYAMLLGFTVSLVTSGRGATVSALGATLAMGLGGWYTWWMLLRADLVVRSVELRVAYFAVAAVLWAGLVAIDRNYTNLGLIAALQLFGYLRPRSALAGTLVVLLVWLGGDLVHDSLNRPGFDGDSISWRMESDGNNVEASVTEAIPGRAS